MSNFTLFLLCWDALMLAGIFLLRWADKRRDARWAAETLAFEQDHRCKMAFIGLRHAALLNELGVGRVYKIEPVWSRKEYDAMMASLEVTP